MSKDPLRRTQSFRFDFLNKSAGGGYQHYACRTIEFGSKRAPKTFASYSDRYRQ